MRTTSRLGEGRASGKGILPAKVLQWRFPHGVTEALAAPDCGPCALKGAKTGLDANGTRGPRWRGSAIVAGPLPRSDGGPPRRERPTFPGRRPIPGRSRPGAAVPH